MLKLSHKKCIALSGLMWAVIAFFLINLGIHLILESPRSEGSLVNLLSSIVHDPEQSALILITVALFLGFLKGKFVLKKAVDKQVKRILSFPSPMPLASLYPFKYYLLIASMIGLGFLMRILPISGDLRGTIDLAIGSALMKGALEYFRLAITPTTTLKLKQGKESL